FDVTSWYGIFGPPALPRDIITRLNSEVSTMVTAPDVKERLAQLGAEPANLTPEAFGRYVRAEVTRWGKVVKESGARLD
ncbi:MAG: Bug family tripartite tricarboxylate transporter substrate binding protein, partial [Burkholderiales bacterium]